MTQEPELLTEYKTRILGAMRKKHGYMNIHQIPKISKVVINTCIGSAQDTKEALEIAKSELTTISGQRPVTTISKKAISNFKLREEQAIGAKVTLRGRIMYEFLERLIKTALPRIRDFRGVSTRAFDGNGNYTLGVTDRIKKNIGFDVTIVTTARTNAEAKSLLTEMGMPFVDKAKKAPVKATEPAA